MDLPVVTPENYYSPEMNMAYMGSTQFKAFEKCEAAALAELRGEHTPPTSQAFLIGGYIDAWFSGELALYQAQHPEIPCLSLPCPMSRLPCITKKCRRA